MSSPISSYVKHHAFCRCDDAVGALAKAGLIALPEGMDSEREINEWWLVSAELAGTLRAAGLPVLRLAELNLWGRFCTGVALAEDPDLLRALPS